jgi:hypothetical protein
MLTSGPWKNILLPNLNTKKEGDAAKKGQVIGKIDFLTAFGFSAAIGIFFGLFSANKAARPDPIDLFATSNKRSESKSSPIALQHARSGLYARGLLFMPMEIGSRTALRAKRA